MVEPQHLSPGALLAKQGAVVTAADALLFLGRCLSFRDTAPSIAALKCAITNRDTDWTKIVGLANRNGVTPALWLALDRKGLAIDLPADLREYLMLIYDCNRQRNQIIVEQAEEAAIALNSHGIRPIFMKGCLTLLEGAGDIGSSMMTDIDMIVPEAEIPEAFRALRSLGYHLLGDSPAHAHAWTFHRPMSLVTIDLHRDVGPQRKILPSIAASRSAVAVANEAAAIEGLSVTHRVSLMIMTFGIFERHYPSGQIPLNNLHNLATLCHRHGDKIDWRSIAGMVSAHRFCAETAAWSVMAHRLLDVSIPDCIRRGRMARRHVRRCLLQLSFPPLDHLMRSYAAITWPFNRFRMDYRYKCGTEGLVLLTARIGHVAAILARRSAWLLRRGPAEFRPTCQTSDPT
jgi:hypothetical protein